MEKIGALAALLLATLILAGGFIAARYYFEEGGTPEDVTILRYGTAAVFLSPIAIGATRKVGVIRCVALSFAGGASFGGLIFLGMTGAPIAHGSAIVPGLGLIVGTLGGALLLNERLTSLRWTGLAVGLAGIGVLVGPGLVSAGDAAWWAELCYILAGLFWAAFTVMLKKWQVHPLQGAAIASVFSIPLLLGITISGEINIASVAIGASLIQAFYQGAVFAIGGIVLYTYAVAKLGAGLSVAAMPLLPFFATLMDWALFDGPITKSIMIAFGLIMVCGVLLVFSARLAKVADVA
ncbi:MAG: DMT family transporter [Pseudomonadota bacterium]